MEDASSKKNTKKGMNNRCIIHIGEEKRGMKTTINRNMPRNKWYDKRLTETLAGEEM